MPKRLRATLLHIVYSKSHEIAIVFIIFIIKKGRCPTRRIRKVNTLLHTTIPALPLKEAQGWSPEEGQRFLSFLWEPSVQKEFI